MNKPLNIKETYVTNEELKKRIKKAEEKLNSYPKWVTDNCIFMGGNSREEIKIKNHDKNQKKFYL